MPNHVQNGSDTSYSFSAMCEDQQNFLPNSFQMQQSPFQPLGQDYHCDTTTDMLNMPHQAASIVDEDDLLRDLFATHPSDMPVALDNNTPLLEPYCGVMLPQNLVEQILATDAHHQDSSSVLEMLRNNIMSSIEAQQPVAPDTRPLTTESIYHEKKDLKKGGVKKRRYVKSGLYRKDKSGNFIYSSSDRARLSQNDENKPESALPQEPTPDAASVSGNRVKRPLNAYNIFCKLHFDQVKTENPELSINELSKLMGEKWKGMSASQKKTYYDKVEHGQTRYKKPLNSYNLYCKKNFDALKKEFPNKSIHVLSKVIAERWKKLSESEKRVYYDEAERQKQQGQQQQQEEAIEQDKSNNVNFNTPSESSEIFGHTYAPNLNFDAFL